MKSFVCSNLLLILFIGDSYGSRQDFEKLDGNHSRSASNCLETLVEVTDWMGHNFLVIFDETVVADDDFLKRYTNFTWRVNSGGNYNFTGLFNVILFTRNFHNLEETLRSISIQRIERRAKLVIRVMEGFANLDEIRKASKRSPAMMWKLDKTRVLYLVPCHDNILAMTYFPFARNCQVGELEVLDTWNGTGFENGTDLFLEKMLDVRGCLQNQSIIFSEFLGFQLRQEFTETGEMALGGVGGKLVTIITEKMNLKLRIISIHLDSWELLVDLIAQGESLLSIAGNIPTADRLKFLEEDIGYMEESYGFAYIIGDLEVSWKNLVWPLPLEVWSYVLCTCVLFCGFICLVNRCYHREITPDQLTIFEAFALFLGTSRVLPRSSFGRYLLGMWIVYSYLINAAYNSGLVSYLTTPREPRIIKTLGDLLAAGMEFGGSKFFKEFYNDPSDPVMMRIYDKFNIWSLNKTNDVFNNREGARGCLATFVYMYNNNLTGNHKVRMLEDRTFSFYSPIFIRRGSPFAFGVHRYTAYTVQSGIVEYWIKYYDRASGFRKMSNTTPAIISIQHLQGIFYLCIIGLTFSAVVLFFELMYYKYLTSHLDHRTYYN